MTKPPLPSYEVHPNARQLGNMMATFEDIGGNLADTYACNQARHEPHITASKNAIALTANKATLMAPNASDQTALILGAGACVDIPIAHLAETFQQTTIVEMDIDASRLAVAKLSRRLQRKISIVQADMTGFLQPVNTALGQATEQSEWSQFVTDFANQLQAIDSTQTLPDLGSNYAFVCSHLVTSQLANTPLSHANHVAQDMYGQELGYPSDDQHVLHAQMSLQRFSARAQSAHLDLLQRSVADSGVLHFADTLVDMQDGIHIPLLSSRIKDEIMARFDTLGRCRAWRWEIASGRTYAVSQMTLTKK